MASRAGIYPLMKVDVGEVWYRWFQAEDFVQKETGLIYPVFLGPTGPGNVRV